VFFGRGSALEGCEALDQQRISVFLDPAQKFSWLVAQIRDGAEDCLQLLVHMLTSEKLEHRLNVCPRAARLNIRARQRHVLLLIKILRIATAQLERIDAAGHVTALGARLTQLDQHVEHLLRTAIRCQTAAESIQVFFFQVCFGELVEFCE
jgi:hypothetical protein